MEVSLVRAGLGDAEKIHKMQLEAFAELYRKYRDAETNPGAEPLSKVVDRLKQPFTYYYFIEADGEAAGAIRVVNMRDPGVPKRISPVFVLPGFRRKGIARAAIAEAERIHGASGWRIDTILQEDGLCRLYESLGYKRTGQTKPITPAMTLGCYEKNDSVC